MIRCETLAQPADGCIDSAGFLPGRGPFQAHAFDSPAPARDETQGFLSDAEMRRQYAQQPGVGGAVHGRRRHPDFERSFADAEHGVGLGPGFDPNRQYFLAIRVQER